MLYLVGHIAATAHQLASEKACKQHFEQVFSPAQTNCFQQWLLNMIFNVEVTDFVADWLQLRRRSYGSQIAGPTWR